MWNPLQFLDPRPGKVAGSIIGGGIGAVCDGVPGATAGGMIGNAIATVKTGPPVDEPPRTPVPNSNPGPAPTYLPYINPHADPMCATD